MKTLLNSQTGIIVGIIVLATLSRFLFLSPEMANFSPIGAIALFAGATLSNKKLAFLIPAASLWLSNLVLNNIFYKEFFPNFSIGFDFWTFLSFFAMVGLSIVLVKKVNLTSVLGANLIGTLAFFVISNFGVWFSGKMYSQDLSGLTTCFAMALPFLKNTLTSNLLFSTILFGLFEATKFQFPKLTKERA